MARHVHFYYGDDDGYLSYDPTDPSNPERPFATLGHEEMWKLAQENGLTFCGIIPPLPIHEEDNPVYVFKYDE